MNIQVKLKQEETDKFIKVMNEMEQALDTYNSEERFEGVEHMIYIPPFHIHKNKKNTIITYKD